MNEVWPLKHFCFAVPAVNKQECDLNILTPKNLLMYIALDENAIVPSTPMQSQFVEVCRGIRAPNTAAQKSYLYWRDVVTEYYGISQSGSCNGLSQKSTVNQFLQQKLNILLENYDQMSVVDSIVFGIPPDPLEQFWGLIGQRVVVRDMGLRANQVKGRTGEKWLTFPLEGAFDFIHLGKVCSACVNMFLSSSASEASEDVYRIRRAYYGYNILKNLFDYELRKLLHSKHLSKVFGSGARSQLKEHRSTNRIDKCWSCRTVLEGHIDLSCSKCKWIACPYCGACGCGRSIIEKTL